MITWSDDVNLDKICLDINKYISNYKMKNYFIYGLQGQERPHVRIAPKITPVLVDLFGQSKYLLETKEVAERYCAGCDTKHWHGECCCDTAIGCELCLEDNITIGIRRDIRGNIPVARKLIKTIIFGLEDKLVIEPSSKLNFGRRVRRKMIMPRKKKVEKADVEEGVREQFEAICSGGSTGPSGSHIERPVLTPVQLVRLAEGHDCGCGQDLQCPVLIDYSRNPRMDPAAGIFQRTITQLQNVITGVR